MIKQSLQDAEACLIGTAITNPLLNIREYTVMFAMVILNLCVLTLLHKIDTHN